jgi:hypothetical protein
VQLDGAPIPNYTVRVGQQSTRTDVGVNFLLRHLPVSPTYEDPVVILDGRTARRHPGSCIRS